jgi:hypothetical protein
MGSKIALCSANEKESIRSLGALRFNPSRKQPCFRSGKIYWREGGGEAVFAAERRRMKQEG